MQVVHAVASIYKSSIDLQLLAARCKVIPAWHKLASSAGGYNRSPLLLMTLKRREMKTEYSIAPGFFVQDNASMADPVSSYLLANFQAKSISICSYHRDLASSTTLPIDGVHSSGS